MQHDDRDYSYLIDLLECCNDIINFTSGIAFEDFDSDKMRRLATERQLETLGEAANHISAGKQQEWSEIDWMRIVGLRNKLAHDYGEILSKRVWLIAKESIPKLIVTVRKILQGHYPEYSE